MSSLNILICRLAIWFPRNSILRDYSSLSSIDWLRFSDIALIREILLRLFHEEQIKSGWSVLLERQRIIEYLAQILIKQRYRNARILEKRLIQCQKLIRSILLTPIRFFQYIISISDLIHKKHLKMNRHDMKFTFDYKSKHLL